MKTYEYEDDGGRHLCKQHHSIRCSECFYVDEIERENKRYREAIEKAISDLENECLWDALVKLKALEREEG